ncbi:hypothetical protein FJT64_017435 [Amphibalanus amphitrite]|uniref:Uncharacterized protein n=1 Tax=Amphibalanus amphitrite TaxID=1232801 RepID=A0A6A4XBK3_AMPAM|nr:hypothetical protein FJT64_017435 [Amphibalanus amphitrite]
MEDFADEAPDISRPVHQLFPPALLGSTAQQDVSTATSMTRQHGSRAQQDGSTATSTARKHSTPQPARHSRDGSTEERLNGQEWLASTAEHG